MLSSEGSKMIEIEDNFLDQTAFNELQAFMMGSDCGWHYNDFKVNNKDIDKFQFVQIFYIQFDLLSFV